MYWLKAAVLTGLLVISPLLAIGQTTCDQKSVLRGLVRDSTDARIPDATLLLDGERTAIAGKQGLFSFGCTTAGKHILTVIAPGFAKEIEHINVPETTRSG